MRLLKPFSFFAAALAFAATSFAAQSTPPSKSGQPTTQSPKAPDAPKRVLLVQPQASVPEDMFQRRDFDKGIYMPTYADGTSMCAAIMSYNFTPGDNPVLKSVTTCTPARRNRVYRTNEKNNLRPPAPLLQLISSPQSSAGK